MPMTGLTRARRRLAHHLVPALLVAVAARQLYLAHARGLSAWKGGGFGMFASVDLPQYRAVRAYLLTPAGEVPAELSGPPHVGTLVSRVRAMPDAGHLDALAGALLAVRWSLDTTTGPRARPAAPERGVGRQGGAQTVAGTPPVAVSGVRIEVWRIRFDGAERRLGLAKLAETVRARS
jgi:hypothetical protein